MGIAMQSRTVLIIEDDQSVNGRLKGLVESIAHTVVTQAFSRVEAELLMAGQRFDLAIVDIQLGTIGKDRYAGLKLLTAFAELNTAVIVVSGILQDNLREVSITLSAYDFIGKPVVEIDFLNKVERALEWCETQGHEEIGNSSWPAGLQPDSKRNGGFLWKGQRVTLTLTQLQLVRCLIETPGRVVPYNRLAEQLKTGSSAKAIAVHIAGVRRAFRNLDTAFDEIDADPGKGYVWKTDD